MAKEPETLADVLPVGTVIGVNVYCRSCARSHSFSVREALARFSPRATLAFIASKSKCSECGKRASEAAWKRMTLFDQGRHGLPRSGP